MRTALICTAAPEAFVLVDEAKRQLKITSTTDDVLLESLVDVACASLEGADGLLKRAIADQSWQLVLPHFLDHHHARGGHRMRELLHGHPTRPWNAVELPLPPAQSVTSIAYSDQDGNLQTLDPGAYRLVDCGTEASFILPTSCWPATDHRPDAVKITFAAGYAADKIPKPIWNAAILIIKGLYELGGQNVFVTGETVFGVGSKTFGVSAGAAQICQDAVDRLLFNYRILGR